MKYCKYNPSLNHILIDINNKAIFLKIRNCHPRTNITKTEINTGTSPLYGQKGVGWVKDPERAAYNKVYNQTTTDFDLAEGCSYGCGCLVFIVMMVILYNFLSAIL